MQIHLQTKHHIELEGRCYRLIKTITNGLLHSYSLKTIQYLNKHSQSHPLPALVIPVLVQSPRSTYLLLVIIRSAISVS